ncbi:oxidoreductase [Daldinia caldariorum]|uniref:oxidoreductase n=1 Tax=Daldinia caldariorum TaxID=326644 RepID=UPI002008C9D7|nr:oxidoreductase [Daldinia caldariorum]KAI1465372.1 oxidoreductase [Daldinia caldariorum]
MTTERSNLTTRILPQITLGDGSPGSLTAPPPPLSQIPATSRAEERFRVTGNAVVTGGAGDLGFATSRALLEHGVEGLMIFDMNPTEAQAKIDLLSSEFPDAKVRFLKVDITDEVGVDAAVSETIKQFGSIGALVNLAGMVACGHALDWSAEDWNRVVNVNTIGGFLVARAVARSMIERGIGGNMTFIASVSAHSVNFPQPQVSYNVSKAGVVAMVKSLAGEWARYGIRVNSISPGYMDTILNEGEGLDEARKLWLSRNPLGRMGQPDELTGAVVMLASRAGTYFNGSDLLMDGGQTLFM